MNRPMRMAAVCLLLSAASARCAATLQETLAAVPPGAHLRVPPGIYEGNLVILKPVLLEGIGKPVIRGTGTSSTITVFAPGCTIDGFVIEHSGGELVKEDAGILLKSDGNRVLRNNLRDVLFGVYFFTSSHNVVAGNDIRGRRQLEVGDRGAGIHIYNSDDNSIEDNAITDMRDGMYLQNANESRILGNRVSGVRYGLHYMYSNLNVFEDNVFENNVAGAAIMYSEKIQFRRNRFIHNRGFSSFGILFQDSRDLLAEHNVIADNEVGIFMESLTATVFRRNLIAANDISIETFSSSDSNTYTENNFIANLSPIRIIGKKTTTKWSAGGVGNYWSEYEGYDLDGDGIGDVPFKIQNLFEVLEGNHPRLRLFFFSPASQALAFAEKAFPVVEGSKEIDEHPLMKPVRLPVKPLVASPQPSTGMIATIVRVLALLLLVGRPA